MGHVSDGARETSNTPSARLLSPDDTDAAVGRGVTLGASRYFARGARFWLIAMIDRASLTSLSGGSQPYRPR